jgi:hypothetical protein
MSPCRTRGSRSSVSSASSIGGKELEMRRVQVRQPRERVRVERQDRAGEQPAGPVAGPAMHDDREAPPGEREPGQQEQVVYPTRLTLPRRRPHGVSFT